jgi:DNA integrity scanning protein DisA with diadenylate cyclase activity
MPSAKFTKQFAFFFEMAVKLSDAAEADAILVMLDDATDWKKLKELAGDQRVLIAADQEDELSGAAEVGFATVLIDKDEAPVLEKLTQALLESVADDLVTHSANVIAIYSGFEAGNIDTVSFIRLDEHLGRLTSRDLQALETRVPLDTLKLVVDLAIEIGREGREGKPVGTMFIVGDTRKTMAICHAAGFDAVKGYGRKERNLQDRRTREAVKEIAQLDGAFLVSVDGTVEKTCQIVGATHANITLSKGLGSRHWAAAAITRTTKAVAIVVSESNGTVRLFQNGEIMLRIEPFRRAMKWVEFEYDPPASGEA